MIRQRYVTRIAVSALVSALAIVLALAAVSPAGAQVPDVQIAQLNCSGDPEVVVIENLGDAAQTLTGWELQSDPPGSETFDLIVLGGLAPGASISIQSGPSASGVFRWTLEPTYRDDDPTDYARIVDDTGAIVHQVNCAEATPTPSPSPTPEPVSEVPDGGGAPPITSDSSSSVMILLVGGSLAVAGVALIALPRLRLRSSLADAASSPHRDYRRANRTRQPISASIGLVLLALAGAVVFQLLRRRA